MSQNDKYGVMQAEDVERRKIDTTDTDDSDDTLMQIETNEEVDNKPDLSFLKLCGINAFALSYGLCFANFGIILLPKETERLWPEHQGIMLGVLLGIAGLSQIVSPLVGVYSDRCTSRYGRRRPFMFWAGIPAILCLPLMWIARTYYLGPFFLLSFFFAMLALTTVYSGYSGLLPDFVNKKQTGAASGIMGVMQLLGSLLGSLIFAVFSLEVSYSYPILASSVIVCLSISLIVAKETPLKEAKPVTKKDILSSYYVSPSEHPDFFWVFIVRTCYYMGISVQIFLLYYLRDVINYYDPERGTGILAVIGQCSAASLAYPAGKLSDRTGRKPLVYLACFVMALTYVGFAFSRTFTAVAIFCAVYGIANGAFVSVDYALACDVLPSKKNAAKDLGVWGISAFLGTMLGPLIIGPILHVVGTTPGIPDHYSDPGYVTIMTIGAVYVLIGGFLLKFIRGAR